MLPEPYNHLAATASSSQTIAAGDVLFRQGAQTQGTYVLKRGCVNLERVGPNGERFIIHRATSGTCFAEASVFSDRYHCDAIAIEAGEVVRIDKSVVLGAFAKPDFARAYARHAAAQIQSQRQLLEIVGIRRAEDRVMAGLVAGFLDGTVVDFAARIHLTHEATYRALRALVDAGRVSNPSRGTYRLT